MPTCRSMTGRIGISMEFPRVIINGIEAIAIKERNAGLGILVSLSTV